jgi:uncharacterized protein
LAEVVLMLLAALGTTQIKLPSGKVLAVQVATLPDDIARGLIGRASVPADSGILLAYPGDVRTRFNLMGYPGPMDILYLDESKTIINLRENAAPCKTAECGYDSIWTFRYALQLPAGAVKRLNLHAGDTLSFEIRP